MTLIEFLDKHFVGVCILILLVVFMIVSAWGRS